MSNKNYDIYDEEIDRVRDGEIDLDEAINHISQRTGDSEREVEMEIQAGVERYTLEQYGLR
ncbi:hypothetical protein SAMN06264855_11023 [Halorubrum vacuolatum]|uniref:Uncharacterized protein n=1 Tax=Halorubrum vacuolatum TaxID=63740 RepID=A0A238WW30_HALVU|nr:hypothetical protein SAMN06264855_11023 [Halorubrum vacuolatum]